MQADQTITAPRRAPITFGGRWKEGLVASVGTLIGLAVSVLASPPAALSVDVWIVAAPLYGAVVGLSLAVLRNGDDAGSLAAGTSPWTLGAVCASTWTALAVVVAGT